VDIITAVLAINPEARASCIEEDYDRITWLDGTTPISKSDIQAKQAELKADYDAKEYQRDRKPEYGSWEEQMDMMYHGTWEAHVQAVKEKYPKEM
jgi:hypothetical protein